MTYEEQELKREIRRRAVNEAHTLPFVRDNCAKALHSLQSLQKAFKHTALEDLFDSFSRNDTLKYMVQVIDDGLENDVDNWLQETFIRREVGGVTGDKLMSLRELVRSDKDYSEPPYIITDILFEFRDYEDGEWFCDNVFYDEGKAAAMHNAGVRLFEDDNHVHYLGMNANDFHPEKLYRLYFGELMYDDTIVETFKTTNKNDG